MAGQIPINYVTHPTVSLKAACFGDNVFDANTISKCISNLLAVGFRRLIVDLYWTPVRRSWSFCPVSVPLNSDAGSSPTSSSSAATSTTTGGDATKRAISAVTSSNGSQLYQLGPYLCSQDLDVSALVDVLRGYFENTTSHLSVYLEFIIFNLHAAAGVSAPDQPAATVSGSELPEDSERLGRLLDGSLGDYIYGPDQLEYERSNLNNSWYRVVHGYEPITEYFTINENSMGQQSTPDGWPCSKYVQLARARRVFFGYGEVDPQLGAYDLASDNVLFAPSYLTHFVNVSSATNGSLGDGCLYDPKAYQVSQVNSSWAQSTSIPTPSTADETASLGGISNMVTNLTACGLSPLLNDTLFGVTAGTDVDPYRNISLSSSWAWAAGQPADSDSGSADDPRERCAVIDLSTGGHWQAIGCSETRRAICRVQGLPFTWRLSTERPSYADASKVCPENTSFSVPRTGLENTYLYRYLLSLQSGTNNSVDPGSADPDMRQVWLDLNSLDIASCWVSGGPDASCPYASNPQQLERRTVLVATIWAVVICVVAALTLFVKCNANRRNSRRGKRIIQGWEYEGVPS